MTQVHTDPDRTEDWAREAAEEWVASFAAAVGDGDLDTLLGLFAEDSWWRDAVALSWDLRSLRGPQAMREFLEPRLAGSGLGDVRLWDEAPPRFVESPTNEGYVEVFIEFRTAVGWGIGVARLVRDRHERWVAWTLMTSLQELDGFELAVGSRRPVGERIPTKSWAARRREALEFSDADPDVLILGAGQAGLAAVAYLQLMGVRALAVEKTPSVGDVWRNRYDSLVLHDPIWLDQLPFMSFPDTWPVYSPKDKVADWFDIYAKALDLNIWTGAELQSAEFSPEDQAWTVAIQRADGDVRVLRPRHFVLAVGMFNEARIPDVADRDVFTGEVRHTSQHDGGKGWAGKRALVVGTGNSGNDVAKDLCDHGAHVTMLQRSPTYVITQAKGLPVLQGDSYGPTGPGERVADLMSLATPYGVIVENAPTMVKLIAEQDREMLDRLTAAGFSIDDGLESGGLVGLGLRNAGGFLLDVGSAEYIADGRISVAHGEIERFTSSGVQLTDGSTLEVDLVIFATGFANMRETARKILGDSVADVCTEVWGLDDEGEIRGMWRPSGHPNFWFTGGSFPYSRVYTRFLAIQIAAHLAGLNT